MISNEFSFYRDRISACPAYGLKAGHQILATVTRCAFHDSLLTEEEYHNIIILAELCHIKMMEDNYNAGWNE